MVACLVAGLLAALPSTTAQATATVPPGFTDELVIGGLDQPTVAAFAPNGRVFIGEKSGIVKTFDSVTDTTPTTTVDLRSQVHDFWDRGLLGLTVDPQYPTRPYVYALYSYNALPGETHPKWVDGSGNDNCPNPPGATADGCVITGQLTKLTVDAAGVAVAEQPLITDWCQQYPSHSIGTVTFGPDGALYVGGGDGASFNFADYGQRGNPCGDPPSPAGTALTLPTAEGGALRSQSPRRVAGEPRTLDGAIARVHPDTGAGMPGNPFASSADANAKRIIAYGMRNPFRFAFRPGTEQLWVGDVGWNDWEEINKIPDAAGGVAENFGWPCYEGPELQPGYDSLDVDTCESLYATSGGHNGPYHAYKDSSKVVSTDACPTGGSSISGIAFEDGTSDYPADYQGALFFSDYSRECIWAMPRGSDGEPDPSQILPFASALDGGPVQLLIGPDGDLYYMAINVGQLRRFNYTPANSPPTAHATGDPTSGPAPLTVRFDGTGSTDPNPGDTLSYAWDLDGDGAYDDATGATPEYTYLTADAVTVGLRVTDQGGLSDSTTVTVTVGDPPGQVPLVVIDAPTPEVTWQVGQAVPFAGRASDPQDGELPASALSWRLTLQHCTTADSCHAHVVQTFDGVADGSFTAPDHDYPSFLDLTLTARDSDGNITSETVRLSPKTVALDFASSPTALQLTVGGSTERTPFSRTVIVGSGNSISAPNPQDPGDYWFTSWSDGGARAHDIVAPEATTTYNASYLTCTVSGAKVADCGGATPSAPRGVSGTGGLRKATVTWREPYWPGIDGVTKYRITVSPGGKIIDGLGPATTSHTVTGLTSGTTYTFDVRAFSASGPGPAGSKTLIGTAATVSSKTISYGTSTTVAGKVYRVDSGVGLGGRSIRIQQRAKGTTSWRTIASPTTNANGTYSLTVYPPVSREYRVVYYSGNWHYTGLTSEAGTVTVKK